jgi:hypothetical protein
MKNILPYLLILYPLVTFATFEDGVDAFNRGDYTRAAREWQPLANAGDADAARNLARLYHQGLGVNLDYYKARQWYRLAASKCNATAQNNLGLLMLNGQGGEKDPVGAFRLFEKAALQGLHSDSDAMGNLAGMYFTGTGTQPNVVEAYKWYLLYAEYTTDIKNKQKLLTIMPQIEKSLTITQKVEALRRVSSFQRIRCTP